MTLSSPGTSGTGTNPEQLFAAGYSACFIGAIKAVAGKQKITLPQDLAIDAEVDLGTIPNAYGIAARLKVSLPGMDRAQAQALVDAAHQVCPTPTPRAAISTCRSRWPDQRPAHHLSGRCSQRSRRLLRS